MIVNHQTIKMPFLEYWFWSSHICSILFFSPPAFSWSKLESAGIVLSLIPIQLSKCCNFAKSSVAKRVLSNGKSFSVGGVLHCGHQVLIFWFQGDSHSNSQCNTAQHNIQHNDSHSSTLMHNNHQVGHLTSS